MFKLIGGMFKGVLYASIVLIVIMLAFTMFIPFLVIIVAGGAVVVIAKYVINMDRKEDQRMAEYEEERNNDELDF